MCKDICTVKGRVCVCDERDAGIWWPCGLKFIPCNCEFVVLKLSNAACHLFSICERCLFTEYSILFKKTEELPEKMQEITDFQQFFCNLTIFKANSNNFCKTYSQLHPITGFFAQVFFCQTPTVST